MSEEQSVTPETTRQFSYGGQAVIEGVLMRGAHTAAVAVRDPEGKIVFTERELNKALYRGRISKTPFLRGLVMLWDALGLGTWALMWAANTALGEEEEVGFDGPLGWLTVAFALLLGVGLFFVLPTAAATGVENLVGLSSDPDAVQVAGSLGSRLSPELTSFLTNLIEGVIRLAILIGYIWLIGRMNDVKRLFGYHGAEHKTINAYEAGADLTPEIVAQYPIEHPRCGTAFLLNVVFISVLVFSVFGRPALWLLILSRIVLIPAIAGIAYEVLRFTARHINNPLIRLIIKPNLALQHLTTNEPDLSMVEVAIAAFKRVLLSEKLITEEEAAVPEAMLHGTESEKPAAIPAGD
jgi:uncharacterized protein YqhQ